MGAPLTIEQMLLNHNVGVSLKDAETLGGLDSSGYAKVSHKHSADDINTGRMDPERLPTATTNAQGIVQLSDSTNSTDSNTAATSKAVNVLKLALDGKTDTGHKHSPTDIQTGTFSVKLKANSEIADGEGIIRNVFISSAAPTSAVGKDGDIYFQYE